MRKVGSTYGTMTVGISNPAQTNIYIWCRVGCEKKQRILTDPLLRITKFLYTHAFHWERALESVHRLGWFTIRFPSIRPSCWYRFRSRLILRSRHCRGQRLQLLLH